MSKSKKLAFFGTEDFSLASLDKLIADDWPIVAVVTKPDSRAGRGRLLHEPKIKQLARQNGIKVLQPEKTSEIESELADLGVDSAILVAYGKILPGSTIKLFGHVINVHPSLLPRYRGPSPIEASILNGDARTGISLMELTEKMDAGPIYCQTDFKLTGSETRIKLRETLAELGAELLVSKLGAILSGEITAKAQPETEATYTKLIKKEDGWIDWQEPAEIIERKIRAYEDFPKTRANLFDKHPVIITKAKLVQTSEAGKLIIKCQPGWLEITELIAPSGRKISGSDFLKGYSQ
jgi:methionyl-tRNA formyltransferase